MAHEPSAKGRTIGTMQPPFTGDTTTVSTADARRRFNSYAFGSFSVGVPLRGRAAGITPEVMEALASSGALQLNLTPARLEAAGAFAKRYLADDECPHGWLPQDGNKSCTCWSRRG